MLERLLNAGHVGWGGGFLGGMGQEKHARITDAGMGPEAALVECMAGTNDMGAVHQSGLNIERKWVQSLF